MNSILPAKEKLPPNFFYPAEFERTIRLGIVELEPWYILFGDLVMENLEGLRQRYPDRNLMPFARRQDNDDIACWDIDDFPKVLVVHDFASPGWEGRAKFSDFYEWLRSALEDYIEFDT